MSTQSTFTRNSMTDLLSSLNNSSSSSTNNNTMNLTPDMALNYQDGPASSSSKNNTFSSSTSDATRHHNHQQRPVSEILKHESFISPETEELDKWFEDLQQYESKLESMANANLDPKYKEEVQHVDQWFRYLNEAERTATIYTLLLHSTPVQIRFFIAVLQQQMPSGGPNKRDSFMSFPYHPEKDMQNQLAGAMAKAELEASQKLLSVLPYQTGQVVRRPNANTIGRRNHIDRHSFALGDTEEYNRLFNSRMTTPAATTSSEFLSPRNSFVGNGLLDDNLLAQQQQQQQRSMQGSQRSSMLFDNRSSSRPKSVIENVTTGDLANIFNQDWSYGGLAGHHQQQQQRSSRPNSVISNAAPSRPRSADISNWSFGASMSSKSVRGGNGGDNTWSGLSSPTLATFSEQQQQQQQDGVDQQLSMMANNWHLNGGSNRSSVILNDDSASKGGGFGTGSRRNTRGASLSNNRLSLIPGTVPETDERLGMQSPPPPTPATLASVPSNIVLSMYDEHNTTSTNLFGNNNNNTAYLMQQQQQLPTSPIPSSSQTQNNKLQQQQKGFVGQYLNPNDQHRTAGADENNGGGYYEDDHHGENSSNNGGASAAAKAFKKKLKGGGGNNSIFPSSVVNMGRNHPLLGGNGSAGNKEKKTTHVDVVDMQLLEDIPAWLRSLRLHKYNPIFETMKWQDMLKMDDEALLGKGVAALGARRKLLKVFDQIKAHCQENNISY